MASAEVVDMDSDIDSLIKDYNSIYREYERIDNSDKPSNTEEYQEDLAALIARTKNLVNGVNEHSLFSQNESLKDIPSLQLRFLLLPALLGYFSAKQCAVRASASSQSVAAVRLTSIEQSKVYYKDFLRLCRLYELPSVPPNVSSDEDPDEQSTTKKAKKKSYLKDAVTRKAEKVMRFKKKKSLESSLEDLFSKINLDHVDDQTQREYYIKLMEKWIFNAVEELEFIEEEVDILNHMSKLSARGEPAKQPQPKHKASRPFILTKSDMQKQVFGLGYPSIPTYTLEEFYEAQVRNGQLPDPTTVQSGPPTADQEALAAEREEVVKEFEIETDNPERLQKARDWDDWKDDHRRGWGNRKNMG